MNNNFKNKKGGWRKHGLMENQNKHNGCASILRPVAAVRDEVTEFGSPHQAVSREREREIGRERGRGRGRCGCFMQSRQRARERGII